jgi:galactitol-specific phosphotransferase system IIB component
VIAVLIELINFTTAGSNCRQAIEYLGKIGVGNQQAIKCLVKLITSGNYEYILLGAIESLAAIDPKNELAILALVQLINSTSNEFIFWDAAKIIIAIDPNKLPNQIITIIQLIYKDFSNISKYLIILENFFHNNETKYTISIDFIYQINNGHDFRIAMVILEQFILSNRNINRDVIVTALTNLIENSNNQNIIILAKEIQENILESYSR